MTDDGGRTYVGYVRQSAHATEAAQRRALRTAGAEPIIAESDETAGLERQGLRRALALAAGAEAAGLMVADLDALTRSLADLGKLVAWADEHDRCLRCLSPVWQSDGDADGGGVVRRLLEWSGEAKGGRRGLSSARPDVAERIASERAAGATYAAIAAGLNRDKVPTLRGGAEWRVSSVQRAAGYRRPGELGD